MKYEWLATRHAKIIDKDSKFSNANEFTWAFVL